MPVRLGRFEADLDVALRCEIVNVIGLVLLHKADEIGRVGQIAVVHEEARLVLMRVKVETVDARRVDLARALGLLRPRAGALSPSNTPASLQ